MNYDNMRDYTEVTIKDAYGDYTVRVPQIDMNINVLIDTVIAPALKASGYLPDMVDTALGLDEACHCGKDGDSKILGDVLDALGICDAECVLEAIDEMKMSLAVKTCAVSTLEKEMDLMEHKMQTLRQRVAELGLKM